MNAIRSDTNGVANHPICRTIVRNTVQKWGMQS